MLSPAHSRAAFGVCCGIKQGQTNFLNADVVGTRNIVNYTGNSAELATLYFDGAGNFSGTSTSNDAGTIANSSVTGTYAVVADGTLTVRFPTSERSPFLGCVFTECQQRQYAGISIRKFACRIPLRRPLASVFAYVLLRRRARCHSAQLSYCESNQTMA